MPKEKLIEKASAVESFALKNLFEEFLYVRYVTPQELNI